MPDPASLPPSLPRPASTGMIVAGTFFILAWIGGHVMWAMMSLVAGLMGNDSGRVSTDLHQSLLLGLLGGEVLTGISGIFGGLAFFIRTKRKALIWWFAGLFVVGAALQVLAIYTFANAFEK